MGLGRGEGGVHVSFVNDCLFFGFCEKGVPYLGHVPKKKWLCLKWVENGFFGLKSHINKLYRSKEDPQNVSQGVSSYFRSPMAVFGGLPVPPIKAWGLKCMKKIFFTPGIRKYRFPGWTKSMVCSRETLIQVAERR